MAGVAIKPKRKRPEKFTPSRASKIEVVEDTPEAEERIAVPLSWKDAKVLLYLRLTARGTWLSAFTAEILGLSATATLPNFDQGEYVDRATAELGAIDGALGFFREELEFERRVTYVRQIEASIDELLRRRAALQAGGYEPDLTSPAEDATPLPEHHAGNGRIPRPSLPATARRIQPRPAEQLGEFLSIPIDSIDANPFQPRLEFDEAEISSLAASLKEHGMRHPLDVRRVGDRFQLVDGERRLRAACLLKWAELPALVKETSDSDMRLLALVQNVQRVDLSDIELARSFKALMDTDGISAESLAAKLRGPDGKERTRSYVANLVRLLELPEQWQERVVSHEMPSTHARYLLPYKDAPVILQAIDKHVKERGLPSLKTWEEQLNGIVREKAVPLARSVHTDDWKQSAEVRISPDHPDFEKLQVVEVKYYGGKKKMALNATLARKILSEKARSWHDRHPSEKQQAKAKGGGKSKGPTPAQLAAAAKAEAERLTKALKQLAGRWCLLAAADKLDDELAPEHGSVQVLLLLLTCESLRNDVTEWMAKHYGMKQTHWLGEKEREALASKMAREMEPVVLTDRFIAALLREHGEATEQWDLFHLEVCLAISQILSADPTEDWYGTDDGGQQTMMGKLTEAFFEAHSEPQLRALCAEWKLDPPADCANVEALRNWMRRPEARPRQVTIPESLLEIFGGKKPAKRPRKAK